MFVCFIFVTFTVSFQWKNTDSLLRNPDFLLKMADFIILQMASALSAQMVGYLEPDGEGFVEEQKYVFDAVCFVYTCL